MYKICACSNHVRNGDWQAGFASLFAPFGGFFASAIKRAHNLDDFSDLIPGHGGFMDRLDCQFIMALCTYVHFSVFIAEPAADEAALMSFDTVVTAVQAMEPGQQQLMLDKLQEFVAAAGGH